MLRGSCQRCPGRLRQPVSLELKGCLQGLVVRPTVALRPQYKDCTSRVTLISNAWCQLNWSSGPRALVKSVKTRIDESTNLRVVTVSTVELMRDSNYSEAFRGLILSLLWFMNPWLCFRSTRHLLLFHAALTTFKPSLGLKIIYRIRATARHNILL